MDAGQDDTRWTSQAASQYKTAHALPAQYNGACPSLFLPLALSLHHTSTRVPPARLCGGPVFYLSHVFLSTGPSYYVARSTGKPRIYSCRRRFPNERSGPTMFFWLAHATRLVPSHYHRPGQTVRAVPNAEGRTTVTVMSVRSTGDEAFAQRQRKPISLLSHQLPSTYLSSLLFHPSIH